MTLEEILQKENIVELEKDIRSLRHSELKKYLGKSDLYDTMSQLFVEMVLELKLFHYPLPRTQKTKTNEWMERTAGVQSKRCGLESESMPYDRLNLLINKAVFGMWFGS